MTLKIPFIQWAKEGSDFSKRVRAKDPIVKRREKKLLSAMEPILNDPDDFGEVVEVILVWRKKV